MQERSRCVLAAVAPLNPLTEWWLWKTLKCCSYCSVHGPGLVFNMAFVFDMGHCYGLSWEYPTHTLLYALHGLYLPTHCLRLPSVTSSCTWLSGLTAAECLLYVYVFRGVNCWPVTRSDYTMCECHNFCQSVFSQEIVAADPSMRVVQYNTIAGSATSYSVSDRLLMTLPDPRGRHGRGRSPAVGDPPVH